MNLISRFRRDERGISSIEYAIMAVFVALAIIVGATSLGSKINAALDGVGQDVASSV
jgi:pilus assembly protein Flp/PilA